MLINRRFDTRQVWFRTEHENGDAAVWTTDWSGIWVVVAGDTYLEPNLTLVQARIKMPEREGLWAAIAAEYIKAASTPSLRTIPACGALLP